MRPKDVIKKLLPPPGPILSLALIGLVLLGGYLYYKAVRFQRFLEPALALTQPGSRFDQQVMDLIRQEFTPKDVNDIRFVRGSIHVRESILVDVAPHVGGPIVYQRLGTIFKDMLDEPEMRANIKVILVSTMARVSDDPVLNKLNRGIRHDTQEKAELILDTLYMVEPELEMKYGTYFETTAIPVYSAETDADWVIFRIIPSEQLHIGVLQKLEKYID